jgi:hypothetical protein
MHDPLLGRPSEGQFVPQLIANQAGASAYWWALSNPAIGPSGCRAGPPGRADRNAAVGRPQGARRHRRTTFGHAAHRHLPDRRLQPFAASGQTVQIALSSHCPHTAQCAIHSAADDARHPRNRGIAVVGLRVGPGSSSSTTQHWSSPSIIDWRTGARSQCENSPTSNGLPVKIPIPSARLSEKPVRQPDSVPPWHSWRMTIKKPRPWSQSTSASPWHQDLRWRTYGTTCVSSRSKALRPAESCSPTYANYALLRPRRP